MTRRTAIVSLIGLGAAVFAGARWVDAQGDRKGTPTTRLPAGPYTMIVTLGPTRFEATATSFGVENGSAYGVGGGGRGGKLIHRDFVIRRRADSTTTTNLRAAYAGLMIPEATIAYAPSSGPDVMTVTLKSVAIKSVDVLYDRGAAIDEEIRLSYASIEIKQVGSPIPAGFDLKAGTAL
jgi:type VI protein secretion system component Hcp